MTPNPTTKGMSEAEVLALVDRAVTCADKDSEYYRRIVRSTIESIFAELARLREENTRLESDLEGSDKGAMRFRDRAERAESDRTALLEVVRRLLPYARDAFEFQASEQAARNDVCDAEAILSRITAPEASR